MTPHFATDEFLRDREAALRSLDEGRIKAFMAKYGVAWPHDERTFWAAVHKARHMCTAFTDAERLESQFWLHEHGFTVFTP